MNDNRFNPLALVLGFLRPLDPVLMLVLAVLLGYAHVLMQSASPERLDSQITHIGIALANSGDKAGAKAAFAEVKTAPRTDIASLWSVYLDNPPTA